MKGKPRRPRDLTEWRPQGALNYYGPGWLAWEVAKRMADQGPQAEALKGQGFSPLRPLGLPTCGIPLLQGDRLANLEACRSDMEELLAQGSWVPA